METGSSSENQAEELARLKKSLNRRDLLLGIATPLATFAAAIAGSWIGLEQVDRQGELSLRDLRIEAYAVYQDELVSYEDALDEMIAAMAEASKADRPPATANDPLLRKDGPIVDTVEAEQREYLTARSKVRLLAEPEHLESADELDDEINVMAEKINEANTGGDLNTLSIYVDDEENDPVWKAYLAFHDEAYAEVRASD